MASLQKKGDSYYCQFLYLRKRYTFTVGAVSDAEAEAVSRNVDYLLMRLRQGFKTLPPGVDVATYVQHNGDPPLPRAPALAVAGTTLAELRDSYLKTFEGALEKNTLATAKIHFGHLARTLGDGFGLAALELTDLQRHVDRRGKGRGRVQPVTVRKEIDTLRAAWNWGRRMGRVGKDFPDGDLVYQKESDKLPFMTTAEIEAKIEAGDDPEPLWACCYLTHAEVEELLDYVQATARHPAYYPMFVFAAHTGARRSEMMRAEVGDLNFAAGTVTVREKKRKRGKLSTRAVPMSSRLRSVLEGYLAGHEGKGSLFGPMCAQNVQKLWGRVLRGGKWARLPGWHCLRHSFISALACRGVDQRVIDGFAGHSTEAMRQRYRHFYPSTRTEAIKLVFG